MMCAMLGNCHIFGGILCSLCTEIVILTLNYLRYKGLHNTLDRITKVQFLLDWFGFGWDRLPPKDPHVYLAVYKLDETGKLLAF